MIGESRFVGAALIPALIQRDRDVEAKKHIERQELYKQINASDENLGDIIGNKKLKAIEYDEKNKNK